MTETFSEVLVSKRDVLLLSLYVLLGAFKCELYHYKYSYFLKKIISQYNVILLNCVIQLIDTSIIIVVLNIFV